VKQALIERILTAGHVSIFPVLGFRGPTCAPEPCPEGGDQMWAVVYITCREPKALLQQILSFCDRQCGDNLKKCLLQLLAIR
jgi:hypothetical protein